jgi:hypothetical protein
LGIRLLLVAPIIQETGERSLSDLPAIDGDGPYVISVGRLHIGSALVAAHDEVPDRYEHDLRQVFSGGRCLHLWSRLHLERADVTGCVG